MHRVRQLQVLLTSVLVDESEQNGYNAYQYHPHPLGPDQGDVYRTFTAPVALRTPETTVLLFYQ
jgi:hypothetical protein